MLQVLPGQGFTNDDVLVQGLPGREAHTETSLGSGSAGPAARAPRASVINERRRRGAQDGEVWGGVGWEVGVGRGALAIPGRCIQPSKQPATEASTHPPHALGAIELAPVDLGLEGGLNALERPSQVTSCAAFKAAISREEDSACEGGVGQHLLHVGEPAGRWVVVAVEVRAKEGRALAPWRACKHGRSCLGG